MAAKKKAAYTADTTETDLLSEVKTFYTLAESAESDNRTRMAEDLRFCYEEGAQWEPTVKANRQGRPCYTYNRTVLAVNQVVGDQRQSKFSGKVSAANKQSAVKTAEIYSGIIRNIEAQSSAETIYDTQFKYAVAGAWGAWRVIPEYCDDNSFEQELRIRDIPNPFTVLFDPSANDPCKRDQNRCVVAERITQEDFKEQYPDIEPSSLQISRDQRGWTTDKEVRIAEYFKRVPEKRDIVELSDGRVMDAADFSKIEKEVGSADAPRGPLTVKRKRTVMGWKVRWWKVCGSAILEGPIDYAWKFIPVIRIPGRYVNIEGKQILQSLHRHSHDPQRTYNYHRSTMVELAALTPRSPYIGTAKMFKGYEEQWAQANKSNRPYLQYDADPDAGPAARPMREPPPDVPAALIALAAQDAEDIKATTGYFNPAMNTNEAGQPESGVALQTRGTRGDSGSYEFMDNLAKAVKFTWEVCVDMIPTVYDTERVVRIIGEDMAEEFATVNQQTDTGDVILNLADGRFDVAVTLGPAYATARQEAVSTLMDATDRMPIIGEVAPDIIVKNLDVQGAAEIEKRVRKRLIQQGIVEPTEQEQKEMPPPAPPDPVQTALAQQLQAKAQKDMADAQKAQGDVAKMPAEMAQLVEDLITKRLANLQSAASLSLMGGATAKVAAVEREVTNGAA